MKFARLTISTIILCISFSLGFIFGHYLFKDSNDMQNRQQGHRDIALYIYREIKNKFGTIKPSDDDYDRIIDGIDIYKDIGFAILEKNGIKTIRVYGYDQE
jgi:hypothetical protein